MLNTFQVNWDQCEQEMICADRGDLPPNIVSFKISKLTPSVLRRAVDMAVGAVQVVQMELPYDPEIVVEADDIQFEDHELVLSGDEIDEHLDVCCLLDLGDDLNLFKARNQEMLSAVVENFSMDSIEEWALLKSYVPNESDENYLFYCHSMEGKKLEIGKRAFYLTQPFGEISTAFIDVRDLDCEEIKNHHGCEVFFNKKMPTIWSAKPGSVLLFTTKGHEQGPAYHATPPCQSENRKVSVVNFSVC